jgi:hypothetical protein
MVSDRSFDDPRTLAIAVYNYYYCRVFEAEKSLPAHNSADL